MPVDVKGLVVTEVKAGSTAERAGLKPGQVVIQIGEVKMPYIRKVPQITKDLVGPVRLVVAGTPPKEIVVP